MDEAEAQVEDRAILRTLYEYSHSRDQGPLARFLDCFTADGVLETHRLGKFQRRRMGREELVEGFKQAPPAEDSKHFTVNPLITVSGDEATVESYWSFLGPVEGKAGVRAYGQYSDKMVRGKDGTWRIRERVIRIQG